MWFWLLVKTSEKWWTTLWFWRGQRSLNKVSVKSFPLSNQEMDSDLGGTVKVRLYCYFPKTECLILEAGTHRTVTASNLYSNTQVPALFLIRWVPWVHSLTGYHPTYKVPFLLPSLSLNSLLWVGYSRTSTCLVSFAHVWIMDQRIFFDKTFFLILCSLVPCSLLLLSSNCCYLGSVCWL